MTQFKPICEYTFSELVCMKKEEFDSVLNNDDSGVGFLINMRKLISMQYEQIKYQVDALTKKSLDSDADLYTKSKCISTIKGLYAILFNLEYKACALYEKVKDMSV